MQLKALRALTEEDKLPPQAKIIVNTIISKVGQGNDIELDALVEELKANGELNTRQDVKRIIGFYRPKLEAAGLIQTTKPAREPKPAKAREPKEKTPKKADVSGEDAAQAAG
jgi:hypothetical protein